MNPQDIAAIGEIVSAVAIVITPAYLAMHVRYNKIAVADQSRQERVAALREIAGRLVENADARQAFDKVVGAEWQGMIIQRFACSTTQSFFH